KKSYHYFLVCKFTTLNKEKINVFKPAITTKVTAKIVASANSANEIVAGSNSSFRRKNKRGIRGKSSAGRR
ncbi:MAG: hypothetical protein M3139_10600, partial [Bacteroidota bacterium]|nr:hypothetical protein [Bacteroidota bacterium]